MTTPGNVLKRHRSAAGLSQQDLAVKLGMSMPVVSQWERGITTPRRDTAEKIDGALDAGGEILAAFGYAPHSDTAAQLIELRDELSRQRAALEELTRLVTRGLATRSDLESEGSGATSDAHAAPRAGRPRRPTRPASG